MARKLSAKGLLALSIASILSTSAIAQRKIEEVVVTAEKTQATVSDTSISITAFTAENLDELGIQSADEMINYIPATTRDTYDIRIRGVGRNFRALGGDPGVATYYNGVYSPDFGIASSESGLYDLQRVEVLRGPQGTLYGRNSIGGAVNYITKKPTFDFEGEVRAQLGDYGTEEFYGVLSGPLIADKLAGRLVASQRDRDAWMEDVAGNDIDSTHDKNIAIALTWLPTDDIEINARINDRISDRSVGGQVFINEGSGATRGTRSINEGVLGLREVAAGTAGAWSYTNPITGEEKWALNRRAGIDASEFPYSPNPAFNQNQLAGQTSGSKSDPNNLVAVNNEGGDCRVFPSTLNSCNAERFDHASGHIEAKWDINEQTSLRFIYGHTEFDYSYNQDIDYSNADFTKYRQTVLETVKSDSYEMQLDWAVGDSWTATTGIYYFDERRSQDYSLSNTTERYTQRFDFDDNVLSPGAAAFWAGFGVGVGNDGSFFGAYPNTPPTFDEVADHTSVLSKWAGDPRGDSFVQANSIENESSAIYTQGTYEFNEEFSLTVGVRWAEDKKTAVEKRRLRFEEDPQNIGADGNPSFLNYTLGALPGLTGQAGYDDTTGRTALAMLNVLYGRATWTADGIAPVCALDDAACATPLLLGGIPLAQTSATSGDDSWDDVNYRVNLDWTPTDDILMYFSVTTGYRAGGYSLGVTDARIATGPSGIVTEIDDPFSYDKETVISYEVGYKGLHLDGTLQLNGSIYRYEYDDYQDRLNVFDPVRGRSVNIVQNAPGATNTGLEVETLWYPTDELSIGANYSYTETEYSDEYLVVYQNDPDLPGSLFGNATTSPELYQRDANGSELKRIPKHKATVWGGYEWQTEMGAITLRATYSYTGEMQSNGVEDELDLIPSRYQVDTSLAWRSVDEKWRARLFVDNVTDERNIREINTGNEGTNFRQTGTLLYPKYWGLDVAYKFGG